MELTSLLLAPVRVSKRLAQGLDDLAAVADRARREPDPVVEIRDRVDTALTELAAVRIVAETLDRTLKVTLDAVQVLTGVAQNVDVTGQQLVVGSADLTAVTKQLDADSRELTHDTEDLTATAKRIGRDLQVIGAVVPRLVSALDTVDRLEGEVETVADTMEPLQETAERVGRVTKRLSRRSHDEG